MNEKRIMSWFQVFGELSLTALQVFYVAYVTFFLQKFINQPQKSSVGIVRKSESMCESCKRKDSGQKRIFKRCHHTYCERCFLRQCVELCQCVHCAVVHIQCRLCLCK